MNAIDARNGMFPADSFVVGCGRYWYAATWTEYFPEIKVANPLPDSAFLYWALQHMDAPKEAYRLLRAIQQYTLPGINGWSLKKSETNLRIEIYMVMYPPMVAQRYGREMPAMKVSRFEPNLNFFTRFEQEFFDQPRIDYDQAALGLVYLFSIHFDLTDDVFESRRISEYTLGVRCSPVPNLPEQPTPWTGYVWDKQSPPTVEQHGFVVDPHKHKEIMLAWIDDVVQKIGWPTGPRPDPQEFLVPWLYEQTQAHNRLGFSYKSRKGGFGTYYRLDYPSFLRFLKEYDYPALLLQKGMEHKSQLEHLFMDVAVVHAVKDGSLAPSRFALYGML